MVVDSILPHAESGPNDHRKVAPPFTIVWAMIHSLWSLWLAWVQAFIAIKWYHPWSSSIGQGRSLRESILLNRTFEENFSADDDSRIKNDLRWFLTWQSMIYTTRSNDFTIGSLRFCGKKNQFIIFSSSSAVELGLPSWKASSTKGHSLKTNTFEVSIIRRTQSSRY